MHTQIPVLAYNQFELERNSDNPLLVHSPAVNKCCHARECHYDSITAG